MNTGHQTTGVCQSGAEVYSVYLEETANGWRITVIVYSEFGYKLPLVSVYATGFLPEVDARRLAGILDGFAFDREEERPFADILGRAREITELAYPVYMIRADIDKDWRK